VNTANGRAGTIKNTLISDSGSPEISATGGLYLGDRNGSMDIVSPNPSSGQYEMVGSNVTLNETPSTSSSSLTTPSLFNALTPFGNVAPTMALAGTGGLTLWSDLGENLTWGSDHANTDPVKFDSGYSAVLTPTTNDLPTISSPIPVPKDEIEFAISVNNGTPLYSGIPAWKTYNQSGIPKTTPDTLTSSQLNTWLSQYESQYPSAWNKTSANQVKIEAYVPKNYNTFGYNFTGQTPSTDQQSATVTINFPAPTQAPTTSNGLVVEQWYLSKYYPHIVETAAQSNFTLTLPNIYGIWPSLSPSGDWQFQMVSPNQSTLPKWLYDTKAVMNNGDTNVKYVNSFLVSSVHPSSLSI
jgi:hypothetical protein